MYSILNNCKEIIIKIEIYLMLNFFTGWKIVISFYCLDNLNCISSKLATFIQSSLGGGLRVNYIQVEYKILFTKETADALKSHICYGNAFIELENGHGTRVRFSLYKALKSLQL